MKDISQYTKIYDGSGHREMFLTEDGSISFLEVSYSRDTESYTECIVSSESLTDALDNEALNGSTFTGKMAMLFGNYDGLQRFQQFCDEKGIDTMTLLWD